VWRVRSSHTRQNPRHAFVVSDRANVHGYPDLVIPDLDRFVDGVRLLLQAFEHIIAVLGGAAHQKPCVWVSHRSVPTHGHAVGAAAMWPVPASSERGW
jgi:hypothetical protein